MAQKVLEQVTPEITVEFKDEAVQQFLHSDEENWEEVLNEFMDIVGEEGLEHALFRITYDDDEGVEGWYVLDWQEQ